LVQNLRDPEGRPLSSQQYSLQQAADGSVVLVPKMPHNGTYKFIAIWLYLLYSERDGTPKEVNILKQMAMIGLSITPTVFLVNFSKIKMLRVVLYMIPRCPCNGMKAHLTFLVGSSDFSLRVLHTHPPMGDANVLPWVKKGWCYTCYITFYLRLGNKYGSLTRNKFLTKSITIKLK
jgi:hypothetical protein